MNFSQTDLVNWDRYKPYILYSQAFEDAIKHMLPLAKEIYPNINFDFLIATSCGVTHEFFRRILFGDSFLKYDVDLSEDCQDGWYSFEIDYEKDGHLFFCYIFEDHVTILQSYIANSEVRILKRIKEQLLYLIQLIENYNFDNKKYFSQLQTLWFELFETFEVKFSTKITFNIDYVGVRSYELEKINHNIKSLIENAEYNFKNNWIESYKIIGDIYPFSLRFKYYQKTKFLGSQ